jgi:hypothetical protein
MPIGSCPRQLLRGTLRDPRWILESCKQDNQDLCPRFDVDALCLLAIFCMHIFYTNVPMFMFPSSVSSTLWHSVSDFSRSVIAISTVDVRLLEGAVL